MILASGARGPGFDSLLSPSFYSGTFLAWELFRKIMSTSFRPPKSQDEEVWNTDAARSGQIWGVFFFFLKKRFSQIPRSGQIWPDLETRSPHLENEPDLGNWPPNLARSGSIRVGKVYFCESILPYLCCHQNPKMVRESWKMIFHIFTSQWKREYPWWGSNPQSFA